MNWDFDADLLWGEEGERYARELLKGLVGVDARFTVEVKRDSKALETGNVYLEYQQLPKGRPPWRKSGLATTDATHFAYIIGNMILIAPVEAWQYVGREFGRSVETGGDNPTRGMVVPIKNLLKRLAQAPF